jgi:hypothetical protein
LPAAEVEKLRLPIELSSTVGNAYYSNIGDAWTILIRDKYLKLTLVLWIDLNVLGRK